MKVKAHLHLPRFRKGVQEVISVSPFAYRPGPSVSYCGTLVLTNAKFRVSEAGRQRTLTTGVKNVHAWVIGDEAIRLHERIVIARLASEFREARYNPKAAGFFLDRETGEAVHSSPVVYMVGSKVFYQEVS